VPKNTSTFFVVERLVKYRHIISSVDGMVAQLVNLISKGYRYYFVGQVADPSSWSVRDSRMIDYYDADLPKWTRERRKLRNEANFRYLRYEDWFIVLVTEGVADRFWSEDRQRIRDVRETAVRFKGYSVSYRQGGYQSIPVHEKPLRNAAWAEYRGCRQRGEKGIKPPRPPRDMKWHVRVELDAETYDGLKAYFLNISTHREANFIANEFTELPFQPYRPVREQLRSILRSVNKSRRAAGYQRIPISVIPFKRRIVRPFGALDSKQIVENAQTARLSLALVERAND
jgi:hypothetical protein